MAVGIGASGVLGVAREAVAGTYVAPEKYVPFLTESLEVQQSNINRRPIRGLVDPVEAVAGPQHPAGSLSFEATHDILPYFLYGMRGAVVKTGTTPNFIYTFTPSAIGTPTTTLSLTIVRNGIVFGYLGMTVGTLQLTMQNEIMVCTAGFVGLKETVQASPTATWPTSSPVGIPGDMLVEIPTATQVYDTDQFTFDVNDNAEPQFRLRDDKRWPSFVKWGERECTLSLERDFENRTDFDAFLAATAQAITISAVTNTNLSVQVDMESAVKNSYAVGLSGQGDLVRSSVDYQGVYSAADSRAYLITVKSTEVIV